jgi:hypothetical protein
MVWMGFLGGLCGAGPTAKARVASCSVKPLFRRKRPSPSRRGRYGSAGLLDERPVAARFDACASRSGPKPGLFLADRAGLTRPRRFLAPGPSLRVPSDTGCRRRASVEDGQRDSPIRPAAGVGSRRAHRGIPRQNGCAVASAMATARLHAPCKSGYLRKPSVGHTGTLVLSPSSPLRPV